MDPVKPSKNPESFLHCTLGTSALNISLERAQRTFLAQRKCISEKSLKNLCDCPQWAGDDRKKCYTVQPDVQKIAQLNIVYFLFCIPKETYTCISKNITYLPLQSADKHSFFNIVYKIK